MCGVMQDIYIRRTSQQKLRQNAIGLVLGQDGEMQLITVTKSSSFISSSVWQTEKNFIYNRWNIKFHEHSLVLLAKQQGDGSVFTPYNRSKMLDLGRVKQLNSPLVILWTVS